MQDEPRLCAICQKPLINKQREHPFVKGRTLSSTSWDGHEPCEIEMSRRNDVSYQAAINSAFDVVMRSLQESCFSGCVNTSRTFKNFKVTTKNEQAFRRMKDHNDNDAGVCLYGPPGTGKTHLLVALCNRYLEDEASVHAPALITCHATERFGEDAFSVDRSERVYKTNPVFIKLSRFFSQLTTTALECREPIVSRIESAFLLAIDDLGSEKLTDFSESVIERVFDYRIENNLVTFVSTNFDPETLSSKFSARICSRLSGLCEFIPLLGKDRRADA